MICNHSELDDLFKYGKESPDFALFLSFIQVEYGLDFLKDQWLSFLDFTRCVEGCSEQGVTKDTYNKFTEAMKELY